MEAENRSILEARLKQARESLDEAKNLIIQDAGVNFVMSSLYYAFFYPVLGLLKTRGITTDSHAEALALFEREFVSTGVIDQRFMTGLRTAAELRPACSCEGKREATAGDVEELLPINEEFLEAVSRIAG